MRQADRSFKAMSDPTRRAILRALRDGPLSAGDLARRLGIAPNALTFHTRVLREARLVRMERSGRRVLCTLNATVMQELIMFMHESFGRLAGEARERAPKPLRRRASARRRVT
jgi:ArsR family transcriptional regulator